MAPVRLVIAQHQTDAPPGLLGDWAVSAGLQTEIVRQYMDRLVKLDQDIPQVVTAAVGHAREGRFEQGMAVELVGPDGVAFGKGIAGAGAEGNGGRACCTRRAPRRRSTTRTSCPCTTSATRPATCTSRWSWWKATR